MLIWTAWPTDSWHRRRATMPAGYFQGATCVKAWRTAADHGHFERLFSPAWKWESLTRRTGDAAKHTKPRKLAEDTFDFWCWGEWRSETSGLLFLEWDQIRVKLRNFPCLLAAPAPTAATPTSLPFSPNRFTCGVLS